MDEMILNLLLTRLQEQQQRQIDEMQNMQRQSMYPGGDAFPRPMSAYGAAGGMMSPGLAYGVSRARSRETIRDSD